jgi:hypothetical protein
MIQYVVVNITVRVALMWHVVDPQVRLIVWPSLCVEQPLARLSV